MAYLCPLTVHPLAQHPPPQVVLPRQRHPRSHHTHQATAQVNIVCRHRPIAGDAAGQVPHRVVLVHNALTSTVASLDDPTGGIAPIVNRPTR